jgi:mono/diheme cytochrome c family protein
MNLGSIDSAPEVAMRLSLTRLLAVVSLPVAVGLCAPALAATNTTADTTPAPTFYREVLPILQENCQECHRSAGTSFGGQLAPMGLETYDEARPWAKAIAKNVESRAMPPWDASPRHKGVFLNERSLENDEIATLVRWAATGAPAGNPKDAPPAKVFVNHDGWMIGEPSLIVKMPEPYFVKDDVKDLYAAFYVDLTDEMLPKDMWIKAFQCKPGSRIIHHFNAHLAYPDEEGGLPEPPSFPGEGQLAPPRAGTFIGGIASGTDSLPLPEGFGIPLKKGTRVTFDVHYHKEPGEGTGVWDRSEIGFLLTDTPPSRVMGGNIDRRGPLGVYQIEIPPGAKAHQLGPVTATFTQDSEIINLMPHMHMRGAAAKFEAIYPDGTREVLLDVPEYDFSWQTVYRYKDLKFVPAGTKIEYTAWYDNTPERGERYGFDPAQTVTFGEESTDEMMMGFVTSAAVAQ